MKKLSMSVLAMSLAACGGGGGGGGKDPSAYAPTTPGAGSTVVSAETTGTIRYGQYRAGDINLSTSTWTLPTVSANVTFNAGTKQGTIQFPLSGATETISTPDGYANLTWSGPLGSGMYRLRGNILMGCDAAAASPGETTQVFVSSSLPRVQNGALDDMAGTSFDVYDCALLRQGTPGTAKLNADGSLTLSVAGTTFPKNQVFDLLNPEKYPSILVNDGPAQNKGFYTGHAYRFDGDNATRYALVIQTNAGSTAATNRYHYYLAVQR